MKKKHITCSFYQRLFFVNLLTEKLWVYFSAKVLPVCWRHTPSVCFFSLHKIKNEQTTWIIYPRNYLLHIGLVLTISKIPVSSACVGTQ